MRLMARLKWIVLTPVRLLRFAWHRIVYAWKRYQGLDGVYRAWLAFVVVFEGLAVLSFMPGSTSIFDAISRLVALAMICTLITVLSSVPIFLHAGFQASERTRARENALTEIRHGGWEARFTDEVNDWYRTVFDVRRYPVPVLLAFLTFLAGWIYVFFHEGPDFLYSFLDNPRMDSVVAPLASGPPLAFGFLGSYFFASWFLFKRYVGGDLGPGAFLHVSVRTWLVTILALVATVVVGPDLTSISSNVAGTKPLVALAFLGALTPTLILTAISDVLSGVYRRASRQATEEVALTEIEGMNPWKAARLAEEGIDNVQNLAMEDPTRLLVVTREGGLRILDWIDQAILVNAAGLEARRSLQRIGIRTAVDLYLAFSTLNLVTEDVTASDLQYRVQSPGKDDFAPLEPNELRNILVSVVHHPTFEKIRRMRERAIRTASELFTTMERTSPVAAEVQPAPVAEREPLVGLTDAGAAPGLPRGVLIVHSGALMGDAIGMGVAVGGRLAVTAIDMGTDKVSFEVASEAGPVLGAARSIPATRVGADLDHRLALFRLDTDPGERVRIADHDPLPGEQLRQTSHFSGSMSGTVSAAARWLAIEGSDGRVVVRDVFLINIPSIPGDGGAGLFFDDGTLGGITIAGSSEQTIAVPASLVRALVDSAQVAGGPEPTGGNPPTAVAGAPVDPAIASPGRRRTRRAS